MSEVLCAAPLIRGTEFFLSDSGQRLFGTCGQRALASAASSVLGTKSRRLETMKHAHSWVGRPEWRVHHRRTG